MDRAPILGTPRPHGDLAGGVPTSRGTPKGVAPDLLQPGATLDNRFRIVARVNRGGMAWIYRAIDLQTGRTVALKVPLFDADNEASTLARFQREEVIGQRLDHPFILKVVTISQRSRAYLVMEFLDGQTLQQFMAASRPTPEAMAASLAGRICEALEYLRLNGVVHRDLKPDNIMICPDRSIRVFDFGVARATRLRRLTRGGAGGDLGTPDYMAPEQVKGAQGDNRADIYSLGTILYEMTTGRVPFAGDHPLVVMNARTAGDPPAPRQINRQLTPQIEEVILHALARNPAERYSTAAEMKAELDDLAAVRVTGRGKRLQPVQPEGEGEKSSRFPRSLIIAVSLLALQAVGFGLVWLLHRHVAPDCFIGRTAHAYQAIQTEGARN